MTQHKGNMTVEQGADTPVYLALLPPATENKTETDVPRGQLVSNRKIFPWAR
jgi:hypothetical protein